MVSHGDYRIAAVRRKADRFLFQPHPDYTNPEVRHAHSLVSAQGVLYPVDRNGNHVIVDHDSGKGTPRQGYAGRNVSYDRDKFPDYPIAGDEGNRSTFAPSVPANYGFPVTPDKTGDFDQGIGESPDGPFINRQDDGNTFEIGGSSRPPYFENIDKGDEANANFWTPNKMISGPGIFGSLSTGANSNIPWRTLLFRPDTEHYGALNNGPSGGPGGSPGMVPDHLMMDMFWMPVVEPFPLSEPFATKGKVNLNYQIVPFDYIKRQTALHAVMRSERLIAIPNSASTTYKTSGADIRHKIDAYETLEQAEDRFKDNEVFRSASEICELYLVKDGTTLGTKVTGSNDRPEYPGMRQFWESHKLTGDNSKERPYSNMYPRLCVRGNVFKVHMTIQTVKKARSTPFDVFDPERDSVTGEWRGSAIVERTFDPNHEDIPDYMANISPTTYNADAGRFLGRDSLENFYSYRVLSLKQFNP